MLSGMRCLGLNCLALLIIFLLLPGAGGAELRYPAEPIAVVETGAHSASIMRMAVDRAGRWVATGSEDKTVRIWEAATGRLVSTLRAPLDPGDVGKIYAVAISPDGRWVAAGGLTAQYGGDLRIYVFDRENSALQHTIKGLANVINDLAVSADGRRLAVSISGPNGIRVYETTGWTEIGRDTDYGSDSYSVDFAGDGRLVATSFDGDLRLYDDALKLLHRQTAPSGRQPFLARFSPDGTEIALGYRDTTAVDILSATDLTRLTGADTAQAKNGSVSKVAWSQEGSVLCAGGRWQFGGSFNLLCWDRRGRGVARRVDTGATNAVFDLAFLRDGDLLVATADPLVTRLNPKGAERWSARGEKPDFRGQRGAGGRSLHLSANGDMVEFGFALWGADRVVLDLSAGRVVRDPPSDLELAPALESGLDVDGWIDTSELTLDGERLPLEHHEVSRSLAIAPDRQRFLLGAEFSLQAFDAAGKGLWKVKPGKVTWAVTVAPNGRVAVAGMDDGTLRWYAVDDGRELLRAFVHPDERWVAWTPEGFFTASETGASLLQYVINRGAERLPDVVAAEQLAERYFRPDLVAARLSGDEAAISAAVAALGPVDDLLQQRQAPQVVLVGDERITVESIDFEHRIRLEAPEAGGLEVVYIVNGVRIARPGARATRRDRRGIVLDQPLTLDPTLPGEDCNRIEAYAQTKDGALRSPSVTQTVCVNDPRYRPPRLFALVIGINEYFDGALGLRWARDDAERVADMLKTQGRGLYDEIRVVPLLDKDATKDNIEAAFIDLAGKVQPSDVFVLYMAGHGFATDGRYHFVPQEARFSNSIALREASLAEERLTELLAGINTAKSLIILDTCESGAFSPIGSSQLAWAARGAQTKFAIDRLMRQTGRAVLAASSAHQEALEGYKGHGLFTWVLLEAVASSDKRFGDGNGLVGIAELNSHLAEEVPKLSKQVFGRAQVPMGTVSGKLEFIYAKNAE